MFLAKSAHNSKCKDYVQTDFATRTPRPTKGPSGSCVCAAKLGGEGEPLFAKQRGQMERTMPPSQRRLLPVMDAPAAEDTNSA